MFEKMSLEQYNEILASKAPTPGGGSALAVVGTIACSLVEMSLNVTLTKTAENSDNILYLQSSLSFFAKAKKRLQQLANDDAEVFRHIIACMHLPKDTDEQKKHRSQELQKAYHKAALVPLDVMRLCKEAYAYAKNRVLPMLYQYVASDCEIAVDLFAAIVKNSFTNVLANTTLLKDLSLKEMLESQGKMILSQM